MYIFSKKFPYIAEGQENLFDCQKKSKTLRTNMNLFGFGFKLTAQTVVFNTVTPFEYFSK